MECSWPPPLRNRSSQACPHNLLCCPERSVPGANREPADAHFRFSPATPTQPLAPPGPPISGHESTPSRHRNRPVYATAHHNRKGRGDRWTGPAVVCGPPRLRALGTSPTLLTLLHGLGEQRAFARPRRRGAAHFGRSWGFRHIHESYRGQFDNRNPVLATRQHILATAL